MHEQFIDKPKNSFEPQTRCLSGFYESRDLLTPKQNQVLDLVGRGLTNDEIGTTLDMSVNTAKIHVKDVFEKLGATNRLHSVLIAKNMGLVDLGSLLVNVDLSQFHRLSSREVEVMEAMTENNGEKSSIKEISAALHLNERGAKYHLGNIYTKIGVNRLVLAGIAYIGFREADPPIHAHVGETQKKEDVLTPEEKEYVFLIASGCSDKEIAEKLNVSYTIVKKRLANVYKKLQVDNRVQASMTALFKGLIEYDMLREEYLKE